MMYLIMQLMHNISKFNNTQIYGVNGCKCIYVIIIIILQLKFEDLFDSQKIN